MAVAAVSNRTCIYVSGEDSKSFLQGMITNDIMLLDSQPAIYACFLTPQGKFLYDFIMTRYRDGYLLEALKDDAPSLIKRFKVYALRDKVAFDVLDDMYIYAFWGEEEPPQTAYQDPRTPMLGYRMVGEMQLETDSCFHDYQDFRTLLGIADGSADLKPELSTVYDGNIDLLNGVSYGKGCYMGQELTARVHYRGLVKRRLFAICADEIPAETDIKKKDGVVVGEILRFDRGHGLALIKIDSWNMPFYSQDIVLTVTKPEWLKI